MLNVAKVTGPQTETKWVLGKVILRNMLNIFPLGSSSSKCLIMAEFTTWKFWTWWRHSSHSQHLSADRLSYCCLCAPLHHQWIQVSLDWDCGGKVLFLINWKGEGLPGWSVSFCSCCTSSDWSSCSCWAAPAKEEVKEQVWWRYGLWALWLTTCCRLSTVEFKRNK